MPYNGPENTAEKSEEVFLAALDGVNSRLDLLLSTHKNSVEKLNSFVKGKKPQSRTLDMWLNFFSELEQGLITSGHQKPCLLNR